MICEIGMDYWEAQACKDFITDIIQKTKSLPDNKGLEYSTGSLNVITGSIIIKEPLIYPENPQLRWMRF